MEKAKLKPLLSYYGGKQRIASKIVEQIIRIPHTVYAEPFCGGLAVLFEKGSYFLPNRFYVEAVNDINHQITTFYRVARDRMEELENAIQFTPYSQEEHRLSRVIYQNPEKYTELQVAWAVYVQCNMSFAKNIGSGWGTSVSDSESSRWQNRKQRILDCCKRLAGIHIGSEDALKFIPRWDSPSTLFYLDPPYPGTDQGHYSGYTIDDYQQLCDLLDNIEGSYILSNYAQDIQPKSVQMCVEIKATMSAACRKVIKDMNSDRVEKLWICNRNGVTLGNSKDEPLSIQQRLF